MDKSMGFGLYLDRTVKTIQLAYQKAFRIMKVNLTIEQWVFLQQIYERGKETSQKELTDLNFRTRATTSKMITKLVNKGYITKTRYKGDLKQFKLQLTSKGQAIIEQLLPFIQDLRSIGYKDIEEKEFDLFLKVLNQIWYNYNQEKVKPDVSIEEKSHLNIESSLDP